MQGMTAAAWAFLAIFACGCVGGALTDIAQRKIPNALCLALLVAGGAYAFMFENAGAWPSHLAFTVLSLVSGALLFRLGWFGAGDAKFLTALSIWFPLWEAPRLLAAIGISGLILLVGWFTYRRLRRKKISRPTDSPFEQLPYGVAIAMGALATFAAT